MKKIIVILALIFLARSVFAQVPGGGGGSGTVTSATITAGTNITTSGTCSSTTSINCTINASGGGGSGTVTSIATSCGISGGPITTTGTLSSAITTNAQTGSSYAQLASDCGKLVTFTNAGAIAVTLSSTNFSVGNYFGALVLSGSVGSATFTPSSGTVNGSASLVMAPGSPGGTFVFDGTNWEFVGSGTVAGSGSVSSVGNVTSDTSLTIAGTGSGPWTGAVTAKINLSNAQTWSNQTFVAPVLGAATGTSLTLGGAALPTNGALALNYSPGTNTATPGFSVINPNAAAAASQQEACALLTGHGWKTNTTAASEETDIQICNIPIQGATTPTTGFEVLQQINGGGYTDLFDYGVTTPGSFYFSAPVTAVTLGNSSTTATITLTTTGLIQFGTSNHGQITSKAAGDIQLGNADAAAASVVAQTLSAQSVAAGQSNGSAQNETIVGSLSTGSGTSGNLIFQTGGTGAAPTTQNSAVNALILYGGTQAVQLASTQYDSCAGLNTNSSGTILCGTTAPPLTVGTGGSLTSPIGYYVCTTTCSVSLPTPAAGVQFCVRDDDAVTTVITIAAITNVQFEKTNYNGYGTVTTGTMTSGGALGDKICLVGRDTTHYLVGTFLGTWTNS
jgi:trimeric autotransporter adhesin